MRKRLARVVGAGVPAPPRRAAGWLTGAPWPVGYGLSHTPPIHGAGARFDPLNLEIVPN